MKVLFVHTFYKEKGGEDQVFNNEVTLLSLAYEVKKSIFFNTGNPAFVISRFLLSPFNISSYLKFKKVLNKEKPDVVHVHNWHFTASPLIFWAAKKLKIPVIHTLHNYRLLCPSATLFSEGEIFTDSLHKAFPWKAVRKKVYRNSFLQTFWLAFIIRLHHWLKTWKQINQYIALTPFAKNLFVQSNLGLKDGQISVKPNFVQDFGYEKQLRKDHFVFIGRLTEEKGIRVLLEAFTQTEYNLTIIGDGPLRELVEVAKKNNANITYLGLLPNSEVNKAMREASALIFPSIWFEGMPMTLLEAFSTGTPVIASKLGAMESMVIPGVNGYLFNPGSATDLIENLGHWQRLNADERLVISENARKVYEEHYTPEKNLQQLIGIYNKVIQKV